jgi:S-DNA-T family DNA segregation ATPase FtsK/SpoIIIE
MNGRNERMSKLPADVCPEDKLTPAMSRNRRLNMPLTVVAIDEVQRYLEHPTHGEEILALLTDLAKVAPSAGFMLVLATQKPDSKVIPDSLRGQLSTRFAMKVMTYQASDTILGAGSYSAAMDASTLLRSHKGVGILLGADDGELAERGGQIVRTHLLGGPGVEQICARGRAPGRERHAHWHGRR